MIAQNRVVLVVGLAFLVAAPSQARGSIGTSALAVSACIKSGTGGELNLRWDGAFNESTTQAMWLDCSLPISYDSELSSPGALFQVQLGYTETSTTAGIDCSMQQRDWFDGTLIETKPTQSSGAAFVGSSFFHFSNFEQGSHAYLSCLVPKRVSSSSRSGIHGMASVH